MFIFFSTLVFPTHQLQPIHGGRDDPPHTTHLQSPFAGGSLWKGVAGGPPPRTGCGVSLFGLVVWPRGPTTGHPNKKDTYTIYYIIKNNKKKQGAPPTRPYSTHNSRQRPARKRDGVVCGGRVRAPVVFCLVFYKGLGARGAPARRGKQCSRLRPRRHGPEGNRSDTAINSTQNKYTINHSINQVRADDCRWL